MPLLLSKSELDSLARTPRQQLADVLERGDWAAVPAVWDDVRTAHTDLISMFRNWVASLQELILREYGREALGDASRLESVAAGMLERGLTAGDIAMICDESLDPVGAAISWRDTQLVLAEFDRVQRGLRHVHDYLRDWISTLLSWAYRNHGIDGLDQALRHSSELLWMPWMAEDVTHDAVQRVRDWARLLKANFATVRAEEDEEKFTLVQDPCGSCTRQHNEGRYEGAGALAMVTEKHPITFMRGDATVYRTHVAVMHFIMPIERIGAPWPTIDCPSQKNGVCRLMIYKNARSAAPEYYERVGMRPPA